jgi:hypothetical protein
MLYSPALIEPAHDRRELLERRLLLVQVAPQPPHRRRRGRAETADEDRRDPLCSAGTSSAKGGAPSRLCRPRCFKSRDGYRNFRGGTLAGARHEGAEAGEVGERVDGRRESRAIEAGDGTLDPRLAETEPTSGACVRATADGAKAVRDQSPQGRDVDPKDLREQWEAAYNEAMEGLQEQTEERLRELQAWIRRSQFRLVK